MNGEPDPRDALARVRLARIQQQRRRAAPAPRRFIIPTPGQMGAETGPPGEVIPQALRGSAESVLATAKQLARLAENVPAAFAVPLGDETRDQDRPIPSGRINAIPGAVAAIERQQQRVAETYGEPTTVPGTLARIGARLGTDVAQFAIPGTAMRAAGVLPATGFAGRLAQNLLAGAPIDILQGQTPETSLYPMLTGREGTTAQRVGLELLADLLLSGGIEAVAGRVAPRGAAWTPESPAMGRAAPPQAEPTVAGTPTPPSRRAALDDAWAQFGPQGATPDHEAYLKAVGDITERFGEQRAVPRQTPAEAEQTLAAARERGKAAAAAHQAATAAPGEPEISKRLHTVRLEDRSRALRGETIPAVERSDGEIFLAPYHGDAWHEAYPNFDELVAGGALPKGAREGFVIKGEFVERAGQYERKRLERVADMQREAGAPADQAAIQEGLFGDRTLAGKEQAELLPATAGVPTARLKPTKIAPEEVSRVRREGGEPAGAVPGELALSAAPEVRSADVSRETGVRRKPVPGAVSPKYRLDDADTLKARLFSLYDRVQSESTALRDEATAWRRDVGFDGVVSGTTITNRGGRAIGRMKDDGRLIDEIEAELKARGVDIDKIGEEYYERSGMELGAIRQGLLQALAGGAVGATVGAALAPDDQRLGYAAVVGLAGAGLGPVAGRALTREVANLPVANIERAAAAAPSDAEAAAGLARQAEVSVPTTRPREPLAVSPAESKALLARRPELAAASDYANVPKLRPVTVEAEELLREQVLEAARRTGQPPKIREPWPVLKAEATRIARDWGLDPTKFDLSAAHGLTRAEMLASRDIVGTNVDRMAELYKAIDGTDDLLRRDQMLKEVDRLEGINYHILGKFIIDRSEYGRNLASLKIIARKIDDPDFWAMRMQRMLDAPTLTREQKAELTLLLSNIRNAATPQAKDEAAKILAQRLVNLTQSTYGEKFITVWKAGLLTSVKTHMVNGLSNTVFQGLEALVTRPAAAMADYFLAKATGMRSVSAFSRAEAAAMRAGAATGWGEAKRIMADAFRGQTALSSEQLLKLDQIKAVNYDWPILNVYTKVIFGALSASDQVFYQMALQGSIANAAKAWAKETKQPIADVVRDIFETYKTGKVVGLAKGAPLDELADGATHAAQEMVFRNQTKLGEAGQKVARTLGVPGQVVLPFTRTPAAVAGQVFNYSPLGFGRATFNLAGFLRRAQLGQALTRLEQQKLAMALSRGAVGSLGLLGLGALLYEKGKATGSFPTDSRERSLWQLEGKQANSVKVGDQWVNFSRLSPVGNVIALGAIMAHAVEGGWSAQALAAGATGLVQTIADQPFLTGISGALEALNEPERSAGRYLERTVASAIPAGIGAIARATEPTVRVGHGMRGAIAARVPGLGESLPVQHTEFGRTISRGPLGYRLFNEIVNPFTMRQANETATVRELARVGTAPGMLGRRPHESETAYQQRKAVVGRAIELDLRRLFRTPGYRQADREAQRDLIEEQVSKTRSRMTQLLKLREAAAARH